MTTTYRTATNDNVDNTPRIAQELDADMEATHDLLNVKKRRGEGSALANSGVEKPQKSPGEMPETLFLLSHRNDHCVPLYFFCRADDCDARDHFKEKTSEWFRRNLPDVGLVPKNFVFSGGLERDMMDYLHTLMMDDVKSKMFVMKDEDFEFLRDESSDPNLQWFVSFDVFYKFESALQCMESPQCENGVQLYACLCHFIPMVGGKYVLYANLKIDRSVTVRDLRNEGQKNVAAERKGLDWKNLTWDSAEIRRAYPHGNHPSPADDDLDIYDVIPSAFMTLQEIGNDEFDSSENDEEGEEGSYDSLLTVMREEGKKKSRKRSFSDFTNVRQRRKRSHSDPVPRLCDSSDSCDGQEYRVDK